MRTAWRNTVETALASTTAEALRLTYNYAGGIDDLKGHIQFCGLPRRVRNRRVDFDLGRALIDLRRPPVQRRAVDWFRKIEPHIPVDSSVECDIGFDGRSNIRVVEVVDLDHEYIILGAEANMLGNVEFDAYPPL